jgi:hypothetical protein
MPWPRFERSISRIYKHVTCHKGSPRILLGTPNEGVWMRWDMAPYILSELDGLVVMFLFRIREVLDSNLGRANNYHDWSVSWVSSLHSHVEIVPCLGLVYVCAVLWIAIPPSPQETLKLLTLVSQGGEKLASLCGRYIPEEVFPFASDKRLVAPAS